MPKKHTNKGLTTAAKLRQIFRNNQNAMRESAYHKKPGQPHTFYLGNYRFVTQEDEVLKKKNREERNEVTEKSNDFPKKIAISADAKHYGPCIEYTVGSSIKIGDCIQKIAYNYIPIQLKLQKTMYPGKQITINDDSDEFVIIKIKKTDSGVECLCNEPFDIQLKPYIDTFYKKDKLSTMEFKEEDIAEGKRKAKKNANKEDISHKSPETGEVLLDEDWTMPKTIIHPELKIGDEVVVHREIMDAAQYVRHRMILEEERPDIAYKIKWKPPAGKRDEVEEFYQRSKKILKAPKDKTLESKYLKLVGINLTPENDNLNYTMDGRDLKAIDLDALSEEDYQTNLPSFELLDETDEMRELKQLRQPRRSKNPLKTIKRVIMEIVYKEADFIHRHYMETVPETEEELSKSFFMKKQLLPMRVLEKVMRNGTSLSKLKKLEDVAERIRAEQTYLQKIVRPKYDNTSTRIIPEIKEMDKMIYTGNCALSRDYFDLKQHYTHKYNMSEIPLNRFHFGTVQGRPNPYLEPEFRNAYHIKREMDWRERYHYLWIPRSHMTYQFVNCHNKLVYDDLNLKHNMRLANQDSKPLTADLDLTTYLPEPINIIRRMFNLYAPNTVPDTTAERDEKALKTIQEFHSKIASVPLVISTKALEATCRAIGFASRKIGDIIDSIPKNNPESVIFDAEALYKLIFEEFDIEKPPSLPTTVPEPQKGEKPTTINLQTVYGSIVNSQICNIKGNSKEERRFSKKMLEDILATLDMKAYYNHIMLDMSDDEEGGVIIQDTPPEKEASNIDKETGASSINPVIEKACLYKFLIHRENELHLERIKEYEINL